jgi:hypothetical protein
MKTLEISDDLMRQIEERASARGVTLSEYLTEAIRRDPPEKRDWREAFGFMADLPEVTNHVDRVVEEEFGQIEPEMWK